MKNKEQLPETPDVRFKEISGKEYNSYWGEGRARTLSKYGAFFVDEPDRGNLYPFCFESSGKYYHGLKNPDLSDEELIADIESFIDSLPGKKVFITLYGHTIVLVIKKIDEGNYFDIIEADNFKPENFKYSILPALERNERSGKIDFLCYKAMLNDGYRMLDLRGDWYILPNYKDIHRMGFLMDFGSPDEQLNLKIFTDCFGEENGTELYEYWEDGNRNCGFFMALRVILRKSNEEKMNLFMDKFLEMIIQYENNRPDDKIDRT